MGRFLTGLSWSQPVASKAHALGMNLGDVQAVPLLLCFFVVFKVTQE